MATTVWATRSATVGTPSKRTPPPCGFGISTPAHAHAAAQLADGVVVGSRAVEVAEGGPDALRAYVASLRQAIDAT